MSRLDEAIIILNELKKHIGVQNKAAKSLADARNFTDANEILTAAMAYTKDKLATAAAKTKASKKNWVSTSDPRFASIIALRNEVDALNTEMGLEKERNIQAATAQPSTGEPSNPSAGTQAGGAAAPPPPAANRMPSTGGANTAPPSPSRSRGASFSASFSEPPAPPSFSSPPPKRGSYFVAEQSRESEEEEYNKALAKVEELAKQKTAVDGLLKAFIKEVRLLKLQEKETTEELTSALDITYRRLTGQFRTDLYHDHAKTMIGKPTSSMNYLGGLMLTLSIVVIAFSIGFAPVLAPAGIAALSFTATTLTGAGCAFFACNKPRGLSKTMLDLDKDAHIKNAIYMPIAAPAA